MARFNAGGAASGAVSGAAAGSAILPGWGTAIGAGIGGLAGGFGGSLDGSNRRNRRAMKPKKLGTLDPRQRKLYKQQIRGLYGKGPLKNLYKFSPNSEFYNFDANAANQVFDQTIARPAYRSFQENVIPSITGQFRRENLMNSSYAGEALGRAGRDVQEGLDAQRASLIFQGQQEANQRKYNDFNNILSRRNNTVENTLNRQTFSYGQPPPRQPGVVEQVLGSVGPAAGQWFANYLNRGSNASPAPNQANLPSMNQMG